MTKQEKYFDIDSIVLIKFNKEKSVSYEWVDTKPKKTFFAWFNTSKSIKSGFLKTDSIYSHIYSEAELIGCGYKVYSKEERVKDRVCSKANVELCLKHDYHIYKTFECDADAQKWITYLISKANKTFEIVNYV